MIFSPRAAGIDAREAGGLLHRHVELDAGGVAPADHLAAAQHLLRAHLVAAHLPDEGVVLAVGDRLALPRHGGEPDDGALAGLAVDLGQHHVGRVAR